MPKLIEINQILSLFGVPDWHVVAANPEGACWSCYDRTIE